MPYGREAAEALRAEIVSAKGAGMWCAGITQTYQAHQLREAGADATIDGLATLTPDWIKRTFPDGGTK